MKTSFIKQVKKLSLDQKIVFKTLFEVLETKTPEESTETVVRDKLVTNDPTLSASFDETKVKDLLNSLKCIH